MTGIQSILEQVRLLLVQHAPAEALQKAVPFAIVCVVAGVGLSVFGAKMSRFGITGAFAILGGLCGAFVGRETGFPAVVCGLIGSAMSGVIGYQTFRVWVAVGAAVVLSLVSLGAFGYQRVLPHMAEFQSTFGPPPAAVADAGDSFTLPSPEAQQAYRERSPQQWADELWTFVSKKDARIEHSGKGLAVAALIAGLFVGVLAVRPTLILSTSLVGTGLVTAGMATFLTHFSPQSYEALQHHPGPVGIGLGAFLVTSLVLQTLLTRNAPKPESESKSK